MNTAILKQYGIIFQKTGTHVHTKANSANLAIYMNGFAKYKPELVDFVENLELANSGHYNSIDPDNQEWSQELGFDIYTGIINSNLVFDLFMEDHYSQTIEHFPIYDIKEIFSSLLEFMS